MRAFSFQFILPMRQFWCRVLYHYNMELPPLDTLHYVTLSPVPHCYPLNPHQPLPVWSHSHLKGSTSNKQSISKPKCATCFWQLEALANVDKWTEPPEGFYESAAAWQIYLLPATASCTGKHRLRYTAQLPLPILLSYPLCVHPYKSWEVVDL